MWTAQSSLLLIRRPTRAVNADFLLADFWNLTLCEGQEFDPSFPTIVREYCTCSSIHFRGNLDLSVRASSFFLSKKEIDPLSFHLDQLLFHHLDTWNPISGSQITSSLCSSLSPRDILSIVFITSGQILIQTIASTAFWGSLSPQPN